MKKYLVTQNNSGGFYQEPKWTGPEGLGGPLGVDMWCFATDEQEAREAFEEYSNVYFDGVDSGKDCECCGDRWGLILEVE